jgi:hypothetical protein
MESNEYFKIEIETNYDHHEVFDISINLDLILAQTYHDKTPLFAISKDAYTPKPGDRLYSSYTYNVTEVSAPAVLNAASGDLLTCNINISVLTSWS